MASRTTCDDPVPLLGKKGGEGGGGGGKGGGVREEGKERTKNRKRRTSWRRNKEMIPLPNDPPFGWKSRTRPRKIIMAYKMLEFLPNGFSFTTKNQPQT